jgi:Tfp pilus assembly PilM family ATPase
MSRYLDLTNVAPPEVALDIGAERVAGAVLDHRGGQHVVSAYSIEPLPEGALVPSLTGTNLHDPGVVEGVVGRVLERLGRPRRVGLLIPDPVAKVSLVRFEQVPARSQDLEQLIRWQVRKAAPFPIDDAQVTFTEVGSVGGGREFLVSVARRDVVQEYEKLASAHGAYAGIVDLSTLNVVNAVLAGSSRPWEAETPGAAGSSRGGTADWLLVNVARDWASIAILRGPQLIFFRTRSAEADGTLADLVHQTAMYYEDRLEGGGFVRAMISGSPSEDVRHGLEQRLAVPVDVVDIRTAAALTDRISVAPALLDALAPLVGLLRRGSETAA